METCRLKALLEGVFLFFANERVVISVLGSAGGLRVIVVSRNLLTFCDHSVMVVQDPGVSVRSAGGGDDGPAYFSHFFHLQRKIART